MVKAVEPKIKVVGKRKRRGNKNKDGKGETPQNMKRKLLKRMQPPSNLTQEYNAATVKTPGKMSAISTAAFSSK